MKKARKLEMEINHRVVSVPGDATVLRAAELNDIYIPSLCSHKDLTPFGGCRLCMVEIEGMRGFPLACSTKAEEGMSVLTDTATLRELRRDILQLILSEHPSSCLVCGEAEECRDNQYTIRKAGVTTGCRYCPNDGQCELQEVVEKVGIADIEYPIYYRGFEAEHDDPFFDRDYNICILCGRCVRMCQEVRGTGILAFKHRGPRVRIGPAHSRSHVEAGCEFCGACVSVCPTGALAEKASKWDGKPDGSEVSTCPFCCLGCQVELLHKNGILSKAHPHLDPEINDGQLCVRGRFSMPETTHHHSRAKKPILKRGDYYREVTWDEALGGVSEKLQGLKPEDFLMVVSGDLTNESLYVAQKFTRSCMSSANIDSTVRNSLAGGLGLWAWLFSLPISISGIRSADSIIAVGLDSRFYFSIAGIELRHALRSGAKLVTIDTRDSNLASFSNHWLRPSPGMEGEVLKAVARGLAGKKADLSEAAGKTGVASAQIEEAVGALSGGRHIAVVIGPSVFAYDSNEALVDALEELAATERATFLPLYNGANSRGALELGALGEILPGVEKAKPAAMTLADVIEGRAKPKVIYLVGEAPFFERSDCEFVIAQDIYYPPFKVDAFLPAASFAEADGTLTNMEGRVQKLVGIENLPEGAITGFARPDWLIFSKLAQRMKHQGFKYGSARAVLKEISEAVPGFPSKPDRKRRRLAPKSAIAVSKQKAAGVAAGSYLLVAEPAGFRHRGIDLSSKVEGLQELAIEEGFHLNPEDLRSLRVGDGDAVIVSNGELEVTGPARANPECPRGTVHYRRPETFGGLEHRSALEPLYRTGGNPAVVGVRAEKATEE